MQKRSMNRQLTLSMPEQIQWSWLGQALWLGLLLTALLGITGARAADDDDPASRVARLSYLKGEVYVQPYDEDAHDRDTDHWIDAQLNRPLTTGDGLTTDNHARAELQMGDANVQVEEESRLRLLSLTDSRAEIQLDRGSINVYLRRDTDGDISILTRNARIQLREAGTYRITAWDDEVTQIQIREGRAEVSGTRQSYPVREGEQLTLRGMDRLSVEYDDVPRRDDFDRWAATRNDRPTRVVSSRYVDSEVIGYEDLDDYGDWRYEADYGYVWAPTHISVGWAPYRFGHWLWIAPWGWTWVDDAPWGFAPFHYGRWAEIGHRWCWVPGPRTVRAMYAPALVAWVGTPSVSISIGIRSNVGWIPLGPRDVYRPLYHGSERYVRNLNLSNSHLNDSEFDRDYRHEPHEQHYSNRLAATVVSAEAFQQARPVQGNLLRTDPSRLMISRGVADIPANHVSRWGNGGERSLPAPHPNTNTRFITPDTDHHAPRDDSSRTRAPITTPYIPRNPDTRNTVPTSPAISTPRPERDVPIQPRPRLPDSRRGNERSDQHGGRNPGADAPRGNQDSSSVPRINDPRERRMLPVEPPGRAVTPGVIAPQLTTPANDNGNNNRRRGRFGEEQIR